MKLMIRLELTTDYLQGSCTTIVLHQQRDDNRSCTYSVSNMGDLQSPALATRHTYRYKRFRRDLNPQSPDRQSGGITNYPMRPLYILACASSIYPQIYTRTLFAIKRKPNGQGEIRTHNVSSVTVLQTACFSHFAYLP